MFKKPIFQNTVNKHRTQDTEHRHRTQNTNTCYKRSSLESVKALRELTISANLRLFVGDSQGRIIGSWVLSFLKAGTTIEENRHLFEVFVNNTNLTFLSFLYKISIEVS